MARADQETVEDLFRRFQSSGEPRLLATVYDRVAPELLLVAVHLGHAEGDAEDTNTGEPRLEIALPLQPAGPAATEGAATGSDPAADAAGQKKSP